MNETDKAIKHLAEQVVELFNEVNKLNERVERLENDAHLPPLRRAI